MIPTISCRILRFWISIIKILVYFDLNKSREYKENWRHNRFLFFFFFFSNDGWLVWGEELNKCIPKGLRAYCPTLSSGKADFTVTAQFSRRSLQKNLFCSMAYIFPAGSFRKNKLLPLLMLPWIKESKTVVSVVMGDTWTCGVQRVGKSHCGLVRVTLNIVHTFYCVYSANI